MRLFLKALWVVFVPHWALAGAGQDVNPFVYEDGENPYHWCRAGHFPAISEHFARGKVTKDTPFMEDSDGIVQDACPSMDAAVCPVRATIAAGAELVIGKEFRGFHCVYDPKKQRSGWVAKAAIKHLPAPKTQPSDWAGEWVSDENQLEIRAEKDVLKVTGEALWLGAVLEDGSQSVHTGELDFTATPVGNRLLLTAQDEYDCAAELLLLPPYLLARDNGNCGGMNVRFNGVYARQ